MLDGDTFGWILWSILALPGAILVWASFSEAVADWRWKLALKRGQIKPRPFEQDKLPRATYARIP